ncbi:MAG: hypothetical protein M3Q60_21530 [Actinomycetota bacterium]|nr:hypothetical protein [Actinomycetota bacterium]
MAETMHCYRHPKRETRVSCATCSRPICTECMRQTEVGIKCPEDARLPRGARAGVMKPNQILWSLLAGVAVVLLGLPVAYLVTGLVGAGSLILSGLAGYGAGTLILRAGGRNGGPVAMTIAGIAVALAFVPFVAPRLLEGNISPFAILEPLVAIGVAVYTSRGS